MQLAKLCLLLLLLALTHSLELFVKAKPRVFGLTAGRYILGREKMPWFNALATCRVNDMELVSFSTAPDFEEFVEFLKKHSPEIVQRESRIWMGAHLQKKRWYWLATGKKVKYSNWSSSKAPPNDKDDPEDICARTSVKIWDAYSCGNDHYFACVMQTVANETHW